LNFLFESYNPAQVMIQLFVFEATHILEWLDAYLRDAKGKIKTEGMASKITDDDNLELLKVLGSVKEFCKKCELGNSQARLENFSYKLSQEKLLNTVIESEIDGLITSLREELNNRYCAFISCRKLEFFERNCLFGIEVWEAFPETDGEIKDAGNCLAADLHTAAVFHLMRVVEYGLRALAAKLRVPVAAGKPIKYATWGAIISALQIKIETIDKKKTSKTKREKDDLDFYRLALNDCNIFKDFWRNDVMHTRGNYDEGEALEVYGRVKEFIQGLVKKGVKRPSKQLASLLRGKK
jgi:hypothetical protein